MDYNDKLKLAKEALVSGSYDKETIEYIFPELKESEDERIRKELIEFFDKDAFDCGDKSEWVNGIKYKDVVAWLKKQVKQKPADKVEPKFHEGEWITNGDYTWKIVEVNPLDYILQSQDGNIVDDTISHVDEQFHSFTIQDAKDGDVLEFSDHERLVVGIVSYINKSTGKVDVCCLLENNNFKVGNYYALDTINPHPATKEQRDQLEKAMADAGYTFDFEKKELKKIEQKPADKIEPKFKIGDIVKHKNNPHLTYILKRFTDDGDYEFHAIGKDGNEGCTCFTTVKYQDEWELVEHKPTVEMKTPEESLGIDSDTYSKIVDECVYGEQKPAWGEEDEEMIRSIFLGIEAYSPSIIYGNGKEKVLNWIKSLKDRYTWKPSEEQILAIETAINVIGKGTLNGKQLVELQEQLKKLKG